MLVAANHTQTMEKCVRTSDHKRQILIVDDDELIQALMRHIVSGLGHSAVLAENGYEGLRAMHYQSFDMIITDMEMPKMDGIRMVSSIRAQSINIPAVLMTGSGKEETLKKTLETWFDYILFKPFQVAEVKTAINTILQPDVAYHLG